MQHCSKGSISSDNADSHKTAKAKQILISALKFVEDHPHRLTEIDHTLTKAITYALNSLNEYTPDIVCLDDICKMYIPVIFADEVYMAIISITPSLADTGIFKPTVIAVNRVHIDEWISARMSKRTRQAAYEAIEREVVNLAIENIRNLSTITCGDTATARRAEESLLRMLGNYKTVAGNLSMSERQLIVYFADCNDGLVKARVVVSFQHTDGKTRVYRTQAEMWDDTNSTWRPHMDKDELCSEHTVRTMIKHDDHSRNNMVDHPQHYGGADNPYEAIKVIEAWLDPSASYGFCIGNALKYICRAGKKSGSSTRQDLEKAIWYLNRACEEAKTNEETAADKK